jgi:hypothetical protein
MLRVRDLVPAGLWLLLTGFAPSTHDMEQLKSAGFTNEEISAWATEIKALFEAAEQGNVKKVEDLLKRGIEANPTDESGVTPLYVAAYHGHPTVVRALRLHGADINASNKDGDTPLAAATFQGHTTVVRLLLDYGADIGARTSDGQTPLHLVAIAGHLDVAELLLERDAYVGVRDKHGYTPLDYAREKGKASMVRLLEKAEVAQMVPSNNALGPKSVPPIVSNAFMSDVDRIPSKTVRPKPHGYAVVIGIEQYRQGLPKVDFAEKDAQVMRAYLTEVMGYAEENIAVLVNDRAAKADIEKYIEHWLPNHIDQNASVFVYFSGHGAPNPKSGDAYLVPFDGDPSFVEATGYSLKRLYESLAKLPAEQIVVMLDSCFSGSGSRSVIASGARPMILTNDNPLPAVGKIVVLTASTGAEISSTYKQKGHGLLTYFILKGLQGNGDQNKDGSIDLTELFGYVKLQVSRVARREFNNDQTPQLLGSPTVLSKRVVLTEQP